jgi:putative radical SAM enzyme (TIGR03279 family)
VGETLTHINGTPIVDVLDYKFYSYDPRLELTLKGEDGTVRTLRVRKREGEDLGLEFETYLMDRARSCANNCIFCFVDQMPPGMRKSLYFKDDDARLSFLMGNYLTLTNLSQREIQRIIDMRISPINISVHTTDPELRAEMLQHKRAGDAIDTMRRFAQHNITMNCQIVACPGINDGPALDRTLRDLAELYPAVNSVAVVPVGVTKFREGLYPLRPYTQAQAAALIDQVGQFGAAQLAERGTRLAWCSDEFYLLAGRPLPEKSFYEDMAQLENGVGMLRLLLSQADMALDEPEVGELVPFSVATGVSAAPFIDQILQKAKKQFPQLQGRVYPIRNRFFGETITVSGLVTGQDLIAQLKGQELGQRLLIPSNMLRSGESVFLDDVTVADVERELCVTVYPIDAESGFDLVDAMLGLTIADQQQIPPGSDGEYYRYNPSGG